MKMYLIRILGGLILLTPLDLNHDAENVVVCLRRATSDKHDLLYYFEIDQLGCCDAASRLVLYGYLKHIGGRRQ